MQDAKQLIASVLLGSLSLIPNNTLRYTSLGIAVCLAAIYLVSLKRPSTQLSRLNESIQETDDIIRSARSICPREHLSLAGEGVRLLEVKGSASKITCRTLETKRFTWKKYRLFSRDVAECARNVKSIRTAVQLIVEAERQRKFADDINEIEGTLATILGHNTSWKMLNARLAPRREAEHGSYPRHNDAYSA